MILNYNNRLNRLPPLNYRNIFLIFINYSEYIPTQKNMAHLLGIVKKKNFDESNVAI